MRLEANLNCDISPSPPPYLRSFSVRLNTSKQTNLQTYWFNKGLKKVSKWAQFKPGLIQGAGNDSEPL